MEKEKKEIIEKGNEAKNRYESDVEIILEEIKRMNKVFVERAKLKGFSIEGRDFKKESEKSPIDFLRKWLFLYLEKGKQIEKEKSQERF